jgi:hypothetical protein
MVELLKRPGAFIPLVISAWFLVALLCIFLAGGLVPQPDEGISAHLFQILMPTQFLIIAFFAITWVPHRPKAALKVLALQASAAAAVLAIVYFRHL